MDYEKIKGFMEASREDSAVQRKPEVKEFPKLDSSPDRKYEDHTQERMAA